LQFAGQDRYIMWECKAHRRGGGEDGGRKGGVAVGGLVNALRGVGRLPRPMVLRP